MLRGDLKLFNKIWKILIFCNSRGITSEWKSGKDLNKIWLAFYGCRHCVWISNDMLKEVNLCHWQTYTCIYIQPQAWTKVNCPACLDERHTNLHRITKANTDQKIKLINSVNTTSIKSSKSILATIEKWRWINTSADLIVIPNPLLPIVKWAYYSFTSYLKHKWKDLLVTFLKTLLWFRWRHVTIHCFYTHDNL